MYANQCYTVDGEELSRDRYPDYLKQVLPQEADYRQLRDIVKAGEWIEPREAQPN
jgi:hypothetical protein